MHDHMMTDMVTLTPRVMAHQPRDGGQTGQAGPGLHGLAGGPGPLRLVLDQAQVVMSDISDDDNCAGARFDRIDGPSSGDVQFDHLVGIFATR